MKTLSFLIAALFTVTVASAQNNNGGYNNNRGYNNNNNRGYDNNNGRYNNNPYNRDADGSVVTITLRGNANDEVFVDGRSYPPGTGNAGNNVVLLTLVTPGQHTLQVNPRGGVGSIFGRRSNNNGANVSTTFTVRSGYDLQITLNQNGRARVRETRSANSNNNNYNNRRDRNDNRNDNYRERDRRYNQ